jgi:hypothetical protein
VCCTRYVDSSSACFALSKRVGLALMASSANRDLMNKQRECSLRGRLVSVY